MAFCDKEKQFIDSGFTTVDNKFIFNYLPDASDIRASIYLFGLALSDSDGDDNSCDTIARKFNISREDVISAFQYWEELGLVHIITGPEPRVIYLSLQGVNTSLKNVKPGKYAKFSRDIQDAISGRMITVHEYNEYYGFLEGTTFEPAALVAVAKYCVELHGNDIGYPYILTVARNQLKRGATTLATVSENLQSQQKYDDELNVLIKLMNLRSYHIHYYDRENYEKWTKNYGFSQEVILAVAKKCKGSGMTKLDNLLSQYYRNGAFSEKEIQHFEKEKTHLYNLAAEINRAIGVYYQSLDMVIEEYVTKWLRNGYDDDTLLRIAKYCFTSGIRTLNGLDAIIDKLYKKGVTNITSLTAYLDNLADTDKTIQNILLKCGLVRRTIASDRTLYKTWIESWNLPLDVIYYAAEQSAGTSNPMTYLNRILSDYKQNGVTTVEQAQARKNLTSKSTATTATVYIGGGDMERRQYTEEEISTLFTALDETED
ncbi:MAG: DnaD domain protein [Clostridiales bacterium]|nr:DnaD domain protein [Clostridiales bacterium]